MNDRKPGLIDVRLESKWCKQLCSLARSSNSPRCHSLYQPIHPTSLQQWEDNSFNLPASIVAIDTHDYRLKLVPTSVNRLSGPTILPYQYTFAYRVSRVQLPLWWNGNHGRWLRRLRLWCLCTDKWMLAINSLSANLWNMILLSPLITFYCTFTDTHRSINHETLHLPHTMALIYISPLSIKLTAVNGFFVELCGSRSWWPGNAGHMVSLWPDSNHCGVLGITQAFLSFPYHGMSPSPSRWHVSRSNMSIASPLFSSAQSSEGHSLWRASSTLWSSPPITGSRRRSLESWARLWATNLGSTAMIWDR